MASVCCGPFHTAAVTTEGLLYTWGDGTFGRLGLGSHASYSEPQLVSELAEKWVQQVRQRRQGEQGGGIHVRQRLPMAETALVEHSTCLLLRSIQLRRPWTAR
jgi:hypothetical protein